MDAKLFEQVHQNKINTLSMSDDASEQKPNFYNNSSRSFARITHFIDEHIRIIQYGVYCTGAAGLIIALHSVRAFTKFNTIKDIPQEFISKHIRLHGQIRWVGLSLPAAPPKVKPIVPLLLLPKTNNSIEKGSVSSEFSTMADKDVRENENKAELKEKPKGLSADNRGIYEYGAGELHPWDDGIDPDVTRIEYDEELHPVYLQVDHTPVISFSRKGSQSVLPLQLADVEVSKVGFQLVKKELLDQRVWFTLVSQNTNDDVLCAWIRPAKFSHRKSINDRLLREGLALTGPMDLDLHHDKQYVKQYMRFLKSQEYAEKKKLGLWKPPPDPASSKGFFRGVFAKLRSLMGKKK